MEKFDVREEALVNRLEQTIAEWYSEQPEPIDDEPTNQFTKRLVRRYTDVVMSALQKVASRLDALAKQGVIETFWVSNNALEIWREHLRKIKEAAMEQTEE